MRLFEITNNTFYHATDNSNLDSIMKHGLKNPYLSNDLDISEYYAEDYDNAIILEILVKNTDNLVPDYNGIEEPLTFTLHKKEDDIWEEWENSVKTWQDSLDIVHTIQYEGIIDPKYIKVLV